MAAAVLTPFAIAQAEEHGSPQPASTAGLQPARIDMTGATPSTPQDGAGSLALAPTGVPGLFYCRKYHIWNFRAERYIAEEQGYPEPLHNMLRARTPADQLGTWEEFSLCSADGGHTVYLTAPSGYLVTAEYNFGGTDYGVLRGRGQWVDVWETFDVWSDSGRYYLRNPSKGAFVTCRVDYKGGAYEMIKGTGGSAGSWEALRFDPAD